MDNEKKLMCEKTQNRIDSVRKNSVEDMRTVDLLIGKSTRASFENKGRKYGFKIQFLYSSDLDGWYDDISKTMYLSLSHAIEQSIVECFNREVKKYNLEAVIVKKSKDKVRNDKKVYSIIFFFSAIIIANSIAFVFNSTISYVTINMWVAIIAIFIIDFFVNWNSYEPIEIKKKEDSSEPILGTMNMCGGIMDFDRIDLNTGLGIYSNYIAFWGIPIIFVGRFLAKEIPTNSWREQRYKVYCKINTPIRVICHFYVVRICCISISMSIIVEILALGNYVGLW